jgi:hypothetical protein
LPFALCRPALVARNSDQEAIAAHSANNRPVPPHVAPISTEAGDYHVHVQWSVAVPSWAPRGDAMMVVDQIAEVQIVEPGIRMR